MSSQEQKTQPIPIVPRQRSESLQSSDSENLSASSPRQRRFSFTEMLGAKTSVGEAYQKYAGFTINGDGFHREKYVKKIEVPIPEENTRHQKYFMP